MVRLLQEREDFRQKAVMSYVKAGMEIYAVLQEPDICNFASILLTASLLSGISSLIYSSQKSDLANSKTIYGDWHYYIETDKELFNSVESGEKGKSRQRETGGHTDRRSC